MCLIAWNWQPHSSMPLLLLFNRDEFYARPALPLHWWEEGDGPSILAGKDLRAGGTWLGLSRSGRLAAITNFRAGNPVPSDKPSRGELVATFLRSDLDATTYLQQLAAHATDYRPFNLLVYDGTTLMGLESRGAKLVHMQPGIGAVSNADFETPWPKVVQLRQRLEDQIARNRIDPADLLPLLQDTTQAPDADLPNTGVTKERERVLSATFVKTADDGTRSCNVIEIRANHARFTETSFGPQGLLQVSQEQFELQSTKI
jgi:uncharacterized protein with NRDE domain